MEDIDFEAPISNLRRLISRDHSEEYKIYVKFSRNNNINNDSENEFIVNTTVNEARIISHKIDEAYQANPTVYQYQIKIPFYFLKENVEQAELEEMMQTIINSAKQKVHVDKEKLRLFTIFQYLLGECEKEKLNELNLLINNHDEAVRLLNSEFHEFAIKYLSNNLSQLIESNQINNIPDQTFIEIIDSYINSDQEKNIADIFEKMKNVNLNKKVLMHFLIYIEFDEFNDDMVQYFNDNLDDEILIEALPRVKLIMKNQATLLHGTKGKAKGKITQCQFNGNDQNGIIAFLNQQNGGDALNNGIFSLKDGLGLDRNTLKNILVPNSGCYGQDCQSQDRAWIEFDFGQRKVNLSSYTIQTCSANQGPKSWQISGSNDRNNWTVLSNMANRAETKGSSVFQRYNCDQSENYYQFIRFTLVESWHSNRYYLHFKYLEFFGSVLEPE